MVKPAGEHQPRRVGDAHRHHSRLTLEKRRQVGHRHAALHARQHGLHRHSAAALVEGDNNLVHLQAARQIGQSHHVLKHHGVGHHDLLPGHGHEPDQRE